MASRFAILAAAAAVLSPGAAAAHDEFAVAGRVTAVAQTSIQITTSTGQVARLKLDKDTRVMAAGKRATAKALKVGQTVQATGIGDTRLDLVALDVVVQPARGRAR